MASIYGRSAGKMDVDWSLIILTLLGWALLSYWLDDSLALGAAMAVGLANLIINSGANTT